MVRLNPFNYLNPVVGKDFIGRKKELLNIFDHINGCQSISIFGPRRVGRTSLLKHIALPSTFQDFGLDASKYILISIDLRGMRESWDEEDLLKLITKKLLEKWALDEKQFFVKGDTRSRFEEILKKFIKEEKKIGILFDEFEIAAENKRLKEAFYGYLRSLTQQDFISKLFYITSSVIPISYLIKEDPKRLSPLSNIFADIPIEPLEKEEARELLSRGEFPHWLIEFIIENIGTHPYLLQIAGWCAFDIQREKERIEEEDLVRLKAEFMTKAKGYFDYFYNRFMSQRAKEIYEEIRKAEDQNKLIEKYLETDLEETRSLINGGLILVTSKLGRWFDEGLQRLQTPYLPKDEIELKALQTTVLFADIIGSTQLADILPDEVYIQFVREFEELVVKVAGETKTSYYEISGDGLMFQFFDLPLAEQVMKALKSAWMIKEKFSQTSLNQERRKANKAEFEMRFGIHTGLAKVGVYPEGKSPKAKGFLLNVAKRIEEVARDGKNTKIYLSEQSYELVKAEIDARNLGKFSLKGISFEVGVYELIDFKS